MTRGSFIKVVSSFAGTAARRQDRMGQRGDDELTSRDHRPVITWEFAVRRHC